MLPKALNTVSDVTVGPPEAPLPDAKPTDVKPTDTKLTDTTPDTKLPDTKLPGAKSTSAKSTGTKPTDLISTTASSASAAMVPAAMVPAAMVSTVVPAAIVLEEQLWLPLDPALIFTHPATQDPVYGPELLGENLEHLTQMGVIVRKQLERIQQLEKALDETLASVETFRLRLMEQEVVEHQLATTEDIANIQQRAIGQLRRQLAEQQALLQAQQQEMQAREQILNEIVAVVEGLIQFQRENLTQYRLDRQLAPPEGRRATDTLEPPIIGQMLHRIEVWLDQAQTQVMALAQQAVARQVVFCDLRANLQQANLQQANLQQANLQQANLQQALASISASAGSGGPKAGEGNLGLVEKSELISLRQALAAAQDRLRLLENDNAQQQQSQAMLQHVCQELETERVAQDHRLAELEQQTAEMQEDLLKRRQQSDEQETAIQHWRDRHGTLSQAVQHWAEQLQPHLDALPQDLAQVLSQIRGSIALVESQAPKSTARSGQPWSAAEGGRLQLPEFVRRSPPGPG
jgi:uncharacterized protein YjbI with pentapeptide repeats